MKDDLDLSPIAKDLNISELSQDAQQEIIIKLGETSLKNAMVTVIDLLPESALSEFEELSNSGDQEKLHYFLKKNIPDFDRIMKNETAKVVADFKRVKAGLS